MPDLFDVLIINKMELRNRFVRSATMDGLATQGMVSEAELNIYQDLAKGEIGLIISHGLFPTKEGQASPGQLSVHTDEAIPSLRKIVNLVHENNGKIVAQILHGGWQCRPEVTGLPPVGPSTIAHPRSGLKIRELSGDEIYELVESYVRAAKRIIEAGFDGVQLHCAHSWLLSAFLSPVTNRREDEWGGSPEKRTNLIREICRGIRRISGDDYPILLKIGIKDYHPKGKSISDGIRQARLLEMDGIDAIEISEGIEADQSHHIRIDAVHPYYIQECTEARQALSLPLILVGGMRSLYEMQAVLDGGIADAISMCRPFIMDPYLVKKLHKNLVDSSQCTSCNQCLGRMRQGFLSCPHNQHPRKETQNSD